VQAKHTELAETKKNKDTQIAELTAQRDQQAKGHQETKQQAELFKSQNEKLSADSAQKLIDNEQLSAQVTALQTKQNELAESQKNKVTQIEKANAEIVKLKNDLEISSKDKVQLLANSERLKKDLLDTRQKLENELSQGTLKKQQLVALAEHVRELESERVSFIEKQQAIDLEMAKVEAQIELIKDVVIREKAF
jgi:chromosome segregation ATPase